MSENFLDISLHATLGGHQNPIYSIAIDSDAKYLYSGGTDKGVVQWDLDSMRFKKVLCQVPSSVYRLLYIPDSTLLVIALRKGGVLIVDVEKQTLHAQLIEPQGAVFALAYNPYKAELIACDDHGRAYVWGTADFKLLYTFQVSEERVRVASLSEDHKLLAFGDKKGTVFLYSAEDYQLISTQKELHQQSVSSLCFNQGSLFSGGRDAKLYELQLNSLHVKQELVPHMFAVYGLVSDSSGKLLASASRDKSLKIWRATDLALLKNISQQRGYPGGHRLSINDLIWKDQYIFTAGDDKQILVWKIQ